MGAGGARGGGPLPLLQNLKFDVLPLPARAVYPTPAGLHHRRLALPRHSWRESASSGGRGGVIDFGRINEELVEEGATTTQHTHTL